MPEKIPSAGLREFFREEVVEHANATLETAKRHLQSLVEAGPGDAVARQIEWLAEIQELIHLHDEHCPLRDLLGESSS